MKNLINIDLENSLVPFFDKEKSRGTIIRDKKYQRTTLVLYLATTPQSMIEFKEIETTAIFDTKSEKKKEKILRKYFKDELDSDPEKVDEFKKTVHGKYGDWRKLTYKSMLTFKGKKSPEYNPQTLFFKFQLPHADHILPQFQEEEGNGNTDSTV